MPRTRRNSTSSWPNTAGLTARRRSRRPASPPASDDAVLAQPLDCRRIVAELAQHLVSVLALVGCRAQFVRLRIMAHMDRLTDNPLRSELGVIDWLGDAEMLDLRVGERLVDRVDWPARHAGLGQQLDPIGAGMPAHDLVQKRDQRRAILGAGDHRGEIGIAEQVLGTRCLAKAAPQIIARGGYVDVSVSGLEHAGAR